MKSKGRLSQPPFLFHGFAAIAYVEGRYTPPGPKLGPSCFLGIYLAKTDPLLSFFTFDRHGKRLSFCAVPITELNVEHAMIWGSLWYHVPVGQWRIPEIGAPELTAVRRLRLLRDLAEARKRVGAVLYHARANVRLRINYPDVKPIFTLRPRSDASMRNDVSDGNI